MKIWLKYLIGIAIGIISAFILPAGSPQAMSILSFVVDIVERFGRYMLLPVLFFSVATAFFKLRDEHTLVKTSLWTFGTIIASSVLLTLIGFAVGMLIHLPPLPIPVEKDMEINDISIRIILTKIFPYSTFDALKDGQYLLPAFIFAGLAGAGAVSDQTASKPAVQLFNSLSKVCYTVMSFFIELLAVGMIAVMARWCINFGNLMKTGTWIPLFFMLLAILLIIGLVIYPLVLRLLCHELHPYKVLYASITPFLVGFFSGDTNLSLVLNLRHGKESLGIRRRTNAFAYPLFSIFARGGTALTTIICFIQILRSYSSLGITAYNALWIAGFSFGISFILGEIPVGGSLITLFVMCKMFGQGFESGYLLFKDIAPLVGCFACAIDVLTAMFGSYIVAVKTKTIEHKDIRRYI